MASIIDHVGLNVQDYAKSKAFYVKALAPLGIELVMETRGPDHADRLLKAIEDGGYSARVIE